MLDCMESPQAGGPEVTLRPILQADLRVFYEHQAEPEATMMAAFPARDETAHFDHWHKVLARPDVFNRTVLYGEEVAGNIVSWVEEGTREIGYWLGRDYWGKGVATKALGLFLELLTERPLEAWVSDGNPGSITVLRRCGFEQVGEEDGLLIFVLR